MTLVTDPDHLLYERYRGPTNRSRKLEAYYALKPLMPRRLQLALRRAYAPRQARARFPAWPIEAALVEHRDATLLARLHASGLERMPFVNWWPERKRFAAVLTHDVEGPAGVANVMRVVELERRYGFVSSWNFVAEWYPIPDGLFDEIRAAGCEIGLHGIRHDGKLFSDRATFDANLPKIAHYAQAWDVAGFRSPATGRDARWMHELPVAYDSSFPDSDPFEPQPGGCCSIMPFLFEDVVELPITLTQDHTVWEILRSPGLDLWRRKSEWLMANHGLINIIVHPDYVVEQRFLDRYEAFLAFLAEHDDGWHALPRDVARWWRQREGLTIASGGAVAGSTDYRASVAYATARDRLLVVET
jgi:peptidoglycan/xylan/chitin deacetylase (PgdA/CDA1 family)